MNAAATINGHSVTETSSRCHMIASKSPRGSDDPYDLSRFVQAQEGVYDRVLAELERGQKRTHWMWYIFPQFDGLGFSSTTRRYSIKSLDEAQEYLNHSLLGPRLQTCAEAVLRVEGRSAWEIFGSPDHMKLQSSATLFTQVSPPESVFEQLLDKYYGGERDLKTIQLLANASK